MPAQLLDTIAQTPWMLAALAALAVGAAHYATHILTGSEWAFEEAGVMQAGAAVVAVTFLVVWALAGGDPLPLVRGRPVAVAAVIVATALLADSFVLREDPLIIPAWLRGGEWEDDDD